MHSLAKSVPDFAVQYFEIRQMFLSYYPNRLRTIFKSINAPRWLTLNKRTKLPTEQILEAVSCKSDSFRGLRWSEKTRFAVLDIDKDSAYHSVGELNRLMITLANAGLKRSVLYKSSISDGWHLYIPFSDWESSNEVHSTLKSLLKASNFEIKSGQLEIFPSRNGLRLPLQHGFAWLDQTAKVVIRREEMTADEAICLFVNDIEDNINDWKLTKLRISEILANKQSSTTNSASPDHTERISTDGFDHVYSNHKIQENYERGRIYWQNGIQDKSEIHDAILCIGHYLWFGDEEQSIPAYPGTWNDKSRERLIRQWLENNHKGFSNSINSGDWRIIEENISRAVEWRSRVKEEREAYPITERVRERLIHLSRKTGRIWHIDDLKHANECREEEAREKIKEAVHELLVEGRKVSGRAIAKITGCSRNTVRKHSDIWLQSGSGVYNLGVRGPLDRSSQEKEKEKIPSELESSKNTNLTENSSSCSVVENTNTLDSFEEAILDPEEEKICPNVLPIQIQKKESLESKYDSADETKQLVIDLATYISKRKEGRGPP